MALLAVAALLFSVPTSAPAAPANTDPEGGTAALRKNLAAASKGYSQAKARLASSKKRQAALTKETKNLSGREKDLAKQAEAVAAAKYKGSNAQALAALLAAGSSPQFKDSISTLTELSRQSDKQLRKLRETRRDLDEQSKKIAAEIKLQAAQERTMAKKKADAEKALILVGGEESEGFGAGPGVAAIPAPRNSDGSFDEEGCTEDDPTTGGCLTPRTLHAYRQARRAGFTHFTACFREASFGEHPQGQACDNAADPDGFGGVATGSSKEYGNLLAGWLVDNADALGVLYVIWFKQIWLPGSGWRSYDEGNGDPASDHTNHVHMSIQ
jgi:hypothetical protein